MTTPITYVNDLPKIPTHLGTDAPHVHHRDTDECLRAPDGVACPTPADLRAEVERLTSVVDVLRAVRDVKAWEAESAEAERDALQQQVDAVRAIAKEWYAAGDGPHGGPLLDILDGPVFPPTEGDRS